MTKTATRADWKITPIDNPKRIEIENVKSALVGVVVGDEPGVET